MENMKENNVSPFDARESHKVSLHDRQETTPLGGPNRQETTPLGEQNRQETTPLGEQNRQETTPFERPERQATTPLEQPEYPERPAYQATPTPLGQRAHYIGQANPYQAQTPYPTVAQPQVYTYPNNLYTYPQPYQTTQAQSYQTTQTQPQQKEKKWSTAALILVAIIALMFGAGLGVGIGMNLDDSSLNNGNEYGSDPFFPEGTEGEPSTGQTVDSAPGIIIINSMLNGGLGAGTGMVISADGYAVTNYHVVEGSTVVQVNIADTDESYTATVVGHDAAVDVALLKLENAKDLDYIEFDTKAPKRGENISVVGNAGGQGYLSGLKGAITAINQDITATIDGENDERLNGLIQTDADVVQGYSGGPMYNSAGKVIGVIVAASSAGQSGDTDGYAIPAKDVVKVIEQIKTGKSKGTTIVGANAALGITVTSENEDGTPLAYEGAYVVQVNHGSAAEAAGIQTGDTITSVNGKSVKSATELSKLVRTFSIGDKVKVTYIDSAGKEKTVEATLGESPVN